MDDVWDVYKPPGGSPKFLLACLNIAYLIACFHHFLLFFLLLCGLLSRLARSKCCLQSWAPTSAPHHGPHGSHGSAAPCRIDLTTVVGGCVPVASVTGDLCHLVKMKNQIHQILEKELMPLMYITANLLWSPCDYHGVLRQSNSLRQYTRIYSPVPRTVTSTQSFVHSREGQPLIFGFLKIFYVPLFVGQGSCNLDGIFWYLLPSPEGQPKSSRFQKLIPFEAPGEPTWYWYWLSTDKLFSMPVYYKKNAKHVVNSWYLSAFGIIRTMKQEIPSVSTHCEFAVSIP